MDQSQTYASHPSHQVFLREYVLDGNNKPVANGELIEGEPGGMATWAHVKDAGPGTSRPGPVGL